MTLARRAERGAAVFVVHLEEMGAKATISLKRLMGACAVCGYAMKWRCDGGSVLYPRLAPVASVSSPGVRVALGC